jgi:hypothetical protein
MTGPAVPVSAAVNEVLGQLADFDCGVTLLPGRRVAIFCQGRNVPLLPPSIPASVERLNDELALFVQRMMVINNPPKGRC